MQKTVDELARRYFGNREVDERETRVIRSALERRTVSRDIGQSIDQATSLGDRLADAIARIGGSWGFIIAFLAFLALWALLNAWLLGRDSFDPYPFIFLNLLLSMLAAIQAPIIMMAQNRQAARDRVDAAHDYEVNLKAEIEIMALHEKMDALRHEQIVAMHEELREIVTRMGRLEAAIAARP